MQLTQEQEKKLKRIAKLVDFETKGAVVLIEDIFALEDEFGSKIPELRELVEELRKERPDRDEIREIVNEIIGGIKIPEAINGEKGEKGEDGKDYILTEKDKKEIAGKIKIPIVEKIIEKTEVKIEQPIIKEVAVITDEELTARGEVIRDGLELLQDDDRLDKKAIKGLDDYDEVSRLARTAGTRTFTGGARTLQQVTDFGATTTNIITVKNPATFTYTSGLLTSITYTNGTTKTLTYNGDNTLNTLTITYPDSSSVVKTFNWTSGLLTSITVI